MEDYCLFTVYSPDPQDCAEPATRNHNGTPLCEHHWEFTMWALAHQNEED